MRNGDIFVESTTWRFGPKLCAFLRETVEGYGRSGSAISSPMETPEKYTPDELSRVPSTRLRFVDYHDLHYHTSAHRGCLDPASFLFGYGPPDSSPIGGSLTLFQNMVYEALSFISAYYAGNLRFNEASSLVAIESGTIVVGTMIYLNDILLPFLNYRAEICNRQEVWTAFNLPTECDLETIWVIGTPETLSGDTHLLTQIAIVPQSFQRANLYGNLKSGGRRTVAYSRARILVVTHMCAECYASEHPVSKTWRQHMNVTSRRALSSSSSEFVAVVSKGPNTVGPATACRFFDIPAYPLVCWKALFMTAKEFPILTNRAAMASGHHASRSLHATNSLLNLAPHVFEQLRCKAFDADAPTELDEDMPQMMYPIYRGIDIAHMCPPRLDYTRRRKELLSTMSCIAVQVVLLLVDTDFKEPNLHTVNAVEAVDFGRAVVAHLVQCYGRDLATDKELVASLVPHKRQIIGKNIVYACGSLREAMSLSTADEPKHSILYAYLGGGVTFQPPHSYSLVFKSMRRAVGIRFLAFVHVLCGLLADDIRVIRRQNRSKAKTLTISEKDRDAAEFLGGVEYERQRLQERQQEITQRWENSFTQDEP